MSALGKAKSNNIDWQNSSAHLNLLSYFLKPRQTETTTKFQKWSMPLGEPVEEAIMRFVEIKKLIEKANIIDHLLAIYNSSALKSFLKERGIPQSGTKEEMAKRLVDNDNNGIQILLGGSHVLICNEQGRKFAEDYNKFEEKRRKDAINQSGRYIQDGKFRQAGLTVANYEANCVFKRGMNTSWNKYDPGHDEIILQYIFSKTPKILIRRGWDKFEDIRIFAGMIHLWGNLRLAEINTEAEKEYAAKNFWYYALFLCELDNYKKNGIKYVEVQTCNDTVVCSACRKVAGIKKYKLDDVPEIPLKDCESELGCRCWINGII